MNFCAEYIREIRNSLEKGDSTEHTHRTALEALLEAYDKDIDATNEPRRIVCGAPDFNITRKGVPVGHVETKDIDVNLDEMERGKGPNGEQFNRYSTLPNWILTDYLEFRWYANGEKRLTVRVADFDGKGRKLTYEDTRYYQRIVVALNETICSMKEIDEAIRQHGDWPTAFSGNNTKE